MDQFSARLDILPTTQHALLPALKLTPDQFVLYGGTAIALQLGHRQSIDFDFFSNTSFKPSNLLKEVPYLANSEVIQQEPNTLSVLVTPEGQQTTVKISFFGGLSLGVVSSPQIINEHSIKVASLLDLLGTKCVTVINRVEAKDYIDIHAIVTQTDLTLADGLAAAKTIYGRQYNPLITLKTLQYFEGGNLDTLTEDVRKDLLNSVRDMSIDKLPLYPSKGQVGQKQIR